MKKTTQYKLRSLIERIIREEIDSNTRALMDDVITYRTLPPQIDYVRPYKLKHDAALQKLEKLSNWEQIEREIDAEVSEYHDSDISNLDAQY